jgi:hypothetical protein
MQIIHETEYIQAQKTYGHLFDICQPKLEMIEKKIDWWVRDAFDKLGTLMVGDLIVLKHESDMMEIHPFPEWVVQMHMVGKTSGKTYAIVPAFEEKDIRKLEMRDWEKRIKKTQEMLDPLTEKDFIAIEYKEGISIKIPPNVPHDFISVVKIGENDPYCQVFEPNFASVVEIFKISTPYFNLKMKLKI